MNRSLSDQQGKEMIGSILIKCIVSVTRGKFLGQIKPQEMPILPVKMMPFFKKLKKRKSFGEKLATNWYLDGLWMGQKMEKLKALTRKSGQSSYNEGYTRGYQGLMQLKIEQIMWCTQTHLTTER